MRPPPAQRRGERRLPSPPAMTPFRQALPLAHPLREVKVLPALTPADWEQRLREREQAAYERGLLTGERTVSEQLLCLRTEVSQLQNGVLESIRQAVPKVIQDAEAGVIALALETARRLVSGLPISAEMVEAAVREALALAEEATEFSILLHPQDLTLLQQVTSPLLAPQTGGDRLHFHASTEVTRGGCLVQTRFGLIDARRETKLKQIEQALTT
jgi:flagellar assembly protein FliH